ncbi:30S ribosomal protein S4 [Candidatus Woesearchaeota archaeon]|nr:30S ribosomal protein S4 [Candidatus Woesearchaeota archaeon]MBW3016602.1 30S ribosomal protein S4 [Candidatus Woesearchaeota archaeon]
MGDPRRFRNQYSRPRHPWQLARIEEERLLVKEYGLKTKRELWKVDSKLKSFAEQAKRLTALRTEQAELEKKQLLERLNRLGLLPVGAGLDDVLGLNVKNLLERRLQTLVFKKGFARSPRQARQFISHRHVLIGNKQMSAPGYLVPAADEESISIVATSSLSNPEHPERVRVVKEVPAEPEPAPEKKPKAPKKEVKKKAPEKEVKKKVPEKEPVKGEAK